MPNLNPTQAATPELELCVAVILQAVRDLTSHEVDARYEAHEFFFQPKGKWAYMRRLYFGLLGLDEESVVAVLKLRADQPPPERPERLRTDLTTAQVFELCPPDRFRAMDLAEKTTMRYTQLANRLNYLVETGLLTRVGRGVFARTDWLALQPKPDDPEVKPTLEDVLDALRSGPKTIREICFALDGNLESGAIRKYLVQAQGKGAVSRDGPVWRIAPSSACSLPETSVLDANPMA